MRQFMYGTDQGLPTNKGNNKNETESQKAPLLHLLNKNATPPSNTNPNAKQQMLAALIRYNSRSFHASCENSLILLATENRKVSGCLWEIPGLFQVPAPDR